MSDDPAAWGAVPSQKDDNPASWGAKPSGGDFSWSQAVTDIPSEIGKEASAGAADVAALAKRGEVGKDESFFSPSSAAEGLMAVPKAVMGALRVPLSPLVGSARSLVGHTMANLEHKAGEYLAPEIAAKDDPQKMYETAKGDVDTALSAVRPGGAPIKVSGPLVTTTHPTTGASITTAPKPAYEWHTSAPGITPGSKLKPVGRVEQPPTEEFFNSAENHYNNMRGYGVEIDRSAMNRVADNITTELMAEGYRPRNVPGVFDAVEELRNPAGANHEIADIDSVRKVLGKARMDPAQRDAARRAIGHIDDYLADLHNNPADVVNNGHFAGRVAESARAARADYAAAKRAEDIEEAIDEATRMAGREGAGGNINNAVRRRLSALRNNKKKMAGWTDEEKAELDRVITGTPAANIARKAGKFAPHGIVSTVMSAGAGHMVAPGIGEVAVPAAGYLAKGIGDRMTMKAAEALLNRIKARSHLGSQNSINAAATSAFAPPSRKMLGASSALPITQARLPQIPRVIMNTAEFSGSKDAQAEEEKRRREGGEGPYQGAGGKLHGGPVNRALGGAVNHNHNPSEAQKKAGNYVVAMTSRSRRTAMNIAYQSKRGYADGGSPFDYSGVGEAMPESVAVAPRPIRRLLGTEPGEERYQLWPEKMVRSGVSLAGDVLSGDQGVLPPGVRRQDYTDIPPPSEPTEDSTWLGRKMGWAPQAAQPNDPMMERAQDMAGLAGGQTLLTGARDAVPAARRAAVAATDSQATGAPLAAIEHAPKFYSGLERTVETLPMNKATGAQWMGTLSNKGVKAEEMQWSGLGEYLQSKADQPVTKAEVAEHLGANKMELGEHTKGGSLEKEMEASDAAREHLESLYENHEPIMAKGEPITTPGAFSHWVSIGGVKPSELPEGLRAAAENFKRLNDKYSAAWENMSGETKYHSYQLPGGENYREKLLTLPNEYKAIPEQSVKEFYNSWASKQKNPIAWDNLDEAAKNDWTRQATRKHSSNANRGESNQYQSSHWDEPNVLVHRRTNEREVSGKPSLHLEEIQSDLHQQARGIRQKEIDRLVKTGMSKVDAAKQVPENMGYALSESERRRWEAVKKKDDKDLTPEDYADIDNLGKRAVVSGLIPDSPFKKNWHELALKDAIREAAEKGIDRLSWTPGEAQAARYDLSKHMDTLLADPQRDGTYLLVGRKNNANTFEQRNVPKEKIADYVGKDVAKNLLDAEKNKYGMHELKGQDLRVGGEGMKGFYDKIIPDALNKIGKPHGVKVQQGHASGKEGRNLNQILEEDFGSDWGSASPELRQKAMDIQDKKTPGGPKVHYMDIPQSLKDQVLKKGFSLFEDSATAGAPLGAAENEKRAKRSRGGIVTRPRSSALRIAYESKRNANGGSSSS